MHNRRFGSLLIGAWLVGTLMVWFVTTQTMANVDRLLSTPPLQIQKELADMGTDAANNLLRHQARETNRRVVEVWEILQIGIAGALFITSLLTGHRSKTSLGAAVLLAAMAAFSAYYLTPAMNALGRSVDFLPAGAASREREAFSQLQVWHTVLDVLKLLVALIVSVRLLFDFYEFRDKFVLRRKRLHEDVAGRSVSGEQASGPATTADSEVSDVDPSDSAPARSSPHLTAVTARRVCTMTSSGETSNVPELPGVYHYGR